MTTPTHDLLIYIGRFNPFHNSHLETIKKAATLAKSVIVFIGSAEKSNTYKNPFTVEERADMIERSLNIAMIGNVRIIAITDNPYDNEAWKNRIESYINKYQGKNTKTGIIGFKKDESSFYLDLFPNLELVDVGRIGDINGTNIRELFFSVDPDMKAIKKLVPQKTYEFLVEYKKTDRYKDIMDQRQFIVDYSAPYQTLPYPPTFITADVLLKRGNDVLLIKRKNYPQKGSWALVGGFLNKNESILNCAIRELKEETSIDIPDYCLKMMVKSVKVFDHPNRDERGRTVTHAHFIEIPFDLIPNLKAADDAEEFKWVNINSLDSREIYADHYHIIQALLK
jgi:bifunctional NMN adenylyltransferase/nudix hydrolase